MPEQNLFQNILYITLSIDIFLLPVEQSAINDTLSCDVVNLDEFCSCSILILLVNNFTSFSTMFSLDTDMFV